MHKIVNGERIKLTKAEEKALKIEWALEEKKMQHYLQHRVYPSWEEQADMQYWDAINGTTKWVDTIKAIKEKHPKN